jgi:DNA-binding response OmpR family regulator
MPVMSGLELISEMVADDKLSDIPIVLLTAKDDHESLLLGKQTGASAYIGKPFSEIELISTIDNLLRLKHKSRVIEDLKNAA